MDPAPRNRSANVPINSARELRMSYFMEEVISCEVFVSSFLSSIEIENYMSVRGASTIGGRRFGVGKWGLGRVRYGAAMGIDGICRSDFLEGFTQRRRGEVFQVHGRVVQVVGGKGGMVGEVAFPEAVCSDELGTELEPGRGQV